MVWLAVAALILTIHATRSWAGEFGPHQFRLNQLTAPERVIDSNPAAGGVRGNSVPNLQRWNAVLLQASHDNLKRQGPGTSPSGEVVAPKRQAVQSQMGRIE